jgi:hypothetical protein
MDKQIVAQSVLMSFKGSVLLDSSAGLTCDAHVFSQTLLATCTNKAYYTLNYYY